MERIKQALEKARKERLQSGADSEVPKFRKSSASVPVNITYTQTRTVDVAKEFFRDKRVIAGLGPDDYTNAYKILRTQILQRLRDNGWNSLAVTSPGSNEGKTLTAINLAISLAMEVNQTVLLVDADLRHPSVHTFFGVDGSPGLSDYLTADTPISELLIHPEGISGLVVLPGGNPLSNSSEMLNSAKMSGLVKEFKERYHSRTIVFDIPPLMTTADALAFSPYVDSVLLVLEEGKTQSEDARRAVELLQGTNLIGTVLNKSYIKETTKQKSEQKWINHIQPHIELAGTKLLNMFASLKRRNK